MLDQASIRRWPDPPQQNQVRIIVIRDDFKIIPRQNLAAGSDGTGYYQLASLPDCCRHAV